MDCVSDTHVRFVEHNDTLVRLVYLNLEVNSSKFHGMPGNLNVSPLSHEALSVQYKH